MSTPFKLGARDLPIEEVILIKTIFRLSAEQLASTWAFADQGQVDAWITDSKSWGDTSSLSTLKQPAVPTLYLGRVRNSLIEPLVMRPIRADDLIAWLAKTAEQLSAKKMVPPVEIADNSAPMLELEGLLSTQEQPIQPELIPVELSTQTTTDTSPLPAKDVTTTKEAKPAALAASEEIQAAPVPVSSKDKAAASAHIKVDENSRYLLRRWPSAQIIGNDPKKIRIASLLSKQALQVNELSSLSGASLDECEGWVTTLLHSQLLEERHIKPLEKKQAFQGSLASSSAVKESHTTTKVTPVSKSFGLIRAIRQKLGI